MHIIEDTRQQIGKHELKHNWWDDNDVTVLRCKLPFGDYSLPPKISVDTKENVEEIAGNIGGAGHNRFINECKLAKEYGCSLVILVENTHGYRSIDDLETWVNPNPHKTARSITGARLVKAMHTIESRYGVRFEFCAPSESAEKIMSILREGNNE